MNLAETIENEPIEMAWWVEILTTIPSCTYYFGPFESMQEAALAQNGYVEDLVNEGAQAITVEIIWCQPRELTIFSEEELAEMPQICEELEHAAKNPRKLSHSAMMSYPSNSELI
jgi:hypothetical protein